MPGQGASLTAVLVGDPTRYLRARLTHEMIRTAAELIVPRAVAIDDGLPSVGRTAGLAVLLAGRPAGR